MLTKERVFQIMGKYYGNAYYRTAIAHDFSEHDLLLISKALDEVNAFGYSFSNLHALSDVEDIRFVPVVLNYFEKFDSIDFQVALLYLICFPSYSEYVPALIRIYEKTDSEQIRCAVSQSLLLIRSRRFVPEYLRIIQKRDYGITHDYVMDLLCKLRVKEAVPKLVELLKTNPHDWRWTFLRYAPLFNEPSLLPYIVPYLESEDSELRMLARKAQKKLSKFIPQI